MLNTRYTRDWHSNYHARYSCLYHVVFCPKYRRPVLTDEIATRLKFLVHEFQDLSTYQVIAIEVMPDHVHLLIDVNPKLGIYKIIQRIKGMTSSKLRSEFPELRRKLPTLWTRGRFFATVGTVQLELVKQYIETQKGV